MKETCEHLFETVRELASTAAIAFPTPGRTPMQVAAWHAYLLTFSRALVEQWQRKLFRDKYGISGDKGSFEMWRDV